MAVINPNELMYKSFEPVQKHRFILYMDGIPSYMIRSVNIPTITQSEIKIDHINVYYKVKGKTTYGDVNMSLYQPISPSGAQMVMEWIRLSHEQTTGRDGYADMYKKRLVINILDPFGGIVGEWVLEGAWIKSSNFGQYDWASDGKVDIELTLAIDHPVLNF